MKELMCKVGGMSFVGTIDSDGMPNIAPRLILETLNTVEEEDTLVFGDLPEHHTYRNLERNPKCTICVVDPNTYVSFQLKGKAIIEPGTSLLTAKIKDKLSKMGLGNQPWETIKVIVTEAFSHKPEEAWKNLHDKASATL